MKQYYVTSLVVSEAEHKNVRDRVEALTREEALAMIFDKYLEQGFEVIKQKVIEL